MKTTKITISKNENSDQILKMLCGEVFHVTKKESFESILESGAILNNKDGKGFGIDNAGTHEKSYSIVKGYVSFFDLRNKHHKHDRKWIDRWLFGNYNIFYLSHFKSFESDLLDQYDSFYFILKPDYYEKIISYDEVKESEADLHQKYHLIPYTECWIDDTVPIEWIKEVYEVHIDRRSMIASMTHGKTPEEIAKIDQNISELLEKMNAEV